MFFKNGLIQTLISDRLMNDNLDNISNAIVLFLKYCT